MKEPVSKFAVEWVNSYRYRQAETSEEDEAAPPEDKSVGLYKLHPLATHSLKAPGFNPSGYEVMKLVSSLSFQTQLVPLQLGRCSHVRAPPPLIF